MTDDGSEATSVALAERDWRLIRDEARDGATQMALEEVAVETALEEDVRTVRVYGWEPSALTMGYHQRAESVDWAYCDREEIDVTRRQTGGGGIYHDAYGDVAYTIVVPAEEVPGDLMDCYELLCEPIVEALRRLGVDAEFATEERPSVHQPACYLRDVHPAHDVVVPASTTAEAGENDDGARKISGNAQYRRRDAVIQHGSITYARDPEHHLGVFADHAVSPGRFAERVTSVREETGSGADDDPVSRERAVQTLENALGEWCDADTGEWRDDELEAAAAVVERKYGADSWVRSREVLETR